MLVRLMYASRATEAVRPETLVAILRKSTHNNALCGVTGVLCFSDNIFVQVLEGGRLPVSKLVQPDRPGPAPHRRGPAQLRGIDERSFAGWSMGQVNMGRLNPALLLKYPKRPTLDPYAVSARCRCRCSTSWWRRRR